MHTSVGFSVYIIEVLIGRSQTHTIPLNSPKIISPQASAIRDPHFVGGGHPKLPGDADREHPTPVL